MTTADQLPENIRTRIAALNAMANHPHSNPNEAALAAEKLAELLTRFGLDSAPTGDGHEAPYGLRYHDIPAAGWRHQLIMGCADANGCSVVFEGNRVAIIGQPHPTEITWMLYNTLAIAIDRMASRHTNPSRSYRNGFRYGAAVEVANHLRWGVEDERTKATVASPDTKALILAKDDALAAAVKRAFPRLRKSASITYDRRGYYAGREAGLNLRAAPGLTTGSGPARLGAGR